MTNLVIVESPAKCSKIQGFLGAGWKVIASLGHIRHLKQDLESVGLNKDFESSWEFMREKSKATAAIKDAASYAKTIYLAADDDREGELIAYSVCLLLKLDPATTHRAVFHEITESAVKAAIAKPRTLDMNKVHAAEARSMLDMMVGFTMSPLLWNHVGPALSAGRCQTPALRLVKDRQTQIDTFQASHSWKVHGRWSIQGQQDHWEANLTDELEDEDAAQTYLEIHHEEPNGKVLDAKTTKWQESPPLPLITSSLQQQASSLFRTNPKITMATAQRLYESGHITYMRTDKAVLSEEAVQEAHKQVQTLYGPQFIGSQQTKPKASKKSKDDSKVQAQEAHEAIRPTHFDLLDLPTTEDWSAKDRSIYKLIWLRAIQSTMAPTNGEQRTITFVADGDDKDDFTWRASWRRTLFNGWRQAATKETTDRTEVDEHKEAEANEWALATSIVPDTILQWKSLKAEPHQTNAPKRYNEANLIQALEQQGIGRPSTFANLITTIQDKSYVETKSFDAKETQVKHLELTTNNQWPPSEHTQVYKYGAEKERLVLTPTGEQVLQYLTKYFDDLFQYKFTATMESRLDAISEGKEPWKDVLRQTWESYKDRYEVQKAAKPTNPVNQRQGRKEFGNGLIATLTKKGPLLLQESSDGDKEKTVFYGWPLGTTLQTITLEQAQAHIQESTKAKQGDALGTHEGHPILRKQGKFGPYVLWNGKTVSCQLTDSLEQIIEKLSTNQTQGKRVGQFEVRNGQYGPYMFKHAITGASRKFVSLPKTVDMETVNEAQLIAIYQHELQQKARSTTYGSSQQSSDTKPKATYAKRGSWKTRS